MYVLVYRLITKDTIEESVMGIQRFKRHVTEALVVKEGEGSPRSRTHIFDIGHTDTKKRKREEEGNPMLMSILDERPELWNDSEYESLDVDTFLSRSL